jgi:hypothetical protein
MADTVTAQLLFNGPRHWAYRFTDLSDSTGESGVTKVNATSGGALGVVYAGQTLYPGVHLKVTKCFYSIVGMEVRIQFHASSNADMLVLNGYGELDFSRTGGIQNPGTTTLSGSTGSIDFTTVGQIAGSTYSIYLEGTKGLPN